MKLRTLLFILAVVLWRPCGAQSPADVMRQIDSVTNPPIRRIETLCFDTEMVQVGRLCEDDTPSTYHFRFENRGDSPLVITDVRTSCGCLRAIFSRRPVPAGARGQIDVTFDPENQAGSLNRRIYVYTNASATHPSARLTLCGEVLPTREHWSHYRVVLSPFLRARRAKVVFRQMSRSQQLTERIECVNTGQKPLRLTTVASKCPQFVSFRTEPEVIAPGQIADLEITINGKVAPDSSRQQFVLHIKNRSDETELKGIGVDVEFMN